MLSWWESKRLSVHFCNFKQIEVLLCWEITQIITQNHGWLNILSDNLCEGNPAHLWKKYLGKKMCFFSIALQEQFILIFLSLNICTKSKEILEIDTSIEHVHECFINQKQCKLENRLCNRKNRGMLIIPALPAAARP